MRSLRPHQRGLMRGPNGEGWVGLVLLLVVFAALGLLALAVRN